MVDAFFSLMDRGGIAMWPLLGLSVVGMALVIERAWFWARTNRAGRVAHVRRLIRLMRQGRRDDAAIAVANDHSVYGCMVRMLLDDGINDAVAAEVLQEQRPRIERYMGTLSTIITAAPMIGILGTVIGLIAAFKVLATAGGGIELADVSGPIAEALLTTAAGLVVAIVMLFPYNAFRSQIERTLGRMESIYESANLGRQVHAEAERRSDSAGLPPKTGVA